jgi:sec-independent protein translocase protein TatB
MFELGTWGEILIIGIAALVLIGPKELPFVLRTCGKWLQKFRHLTYHFRHQLSRYIHEGEFEEYRQQINDVFLKNDATRKPDQTDPL